MYEIKVDIKRRTVSPHGQQPFSHEVSPTRGLNLASEGNLFDAPSPRKKSRSVDRHKGQMKNKKDEIKKVKKGDRQVHPSRFLLFHFFFSFLLFDCFSLCLGDLRWKSVEAL